MGGSQLLTSVILPLRIDDKLTATVMTATLALPEACRDTVLTIIADSSKEFSAHEQVAEVLNKMMVRCMLAVDVRSNFMENAPRQDEMSWFVVDLAGPPAIIIYEPRQARKGATVVVTLCAGVWLAGFASIIFVFSEFFLPGSAQTLPDRAISRLLG